MAVYQQDPNMQSSEIPEESRSPNDFPPSSGLPPDAMMMLAGMQPGMMSGPGGGMTPGADQMSASAMGPMAGGNVGTSAGPGAQMAGMPAPDPMMAVRQQFDQVTTELQMLAQAYPMAAEELMSAGEAIARAMLRIAQGVQPNPAQPPMPA